MDAVLGHLPELLMLVLRPKGRFRIEGTHVVESKLGLSRLEARWRAVEVWTLSAAQFLAEGDVGVTPWIPLMQFDGPPETLLEQCAAKIEREAHPRDRADLLGVSQVLAELRFPNPELLTLFGGDQALIESPLLQRMLAKRSHEDILIILTDRFGTVPQDVANRLREIIDEKKLRKLLLLSAKCPDMEAFREALLS
jgi:hypothetical protein